MLLQILSRKSRGDKYNKTENNIITAVPFTITGAIVHRNTLLYLKKLAFHPKLKGRREEKKGGWRRV